MIWERDDGTLLLITTLSALLALPSEGRYSVTDASACFICPPTAPLVVPAVSFATVGQLRGQHCTMRPLRPVLAAKPAKLPAFGLFISLFPTDAGHLAVFNAQNQPDRASLWDEPSAN